MALLPSLPAMCMRQASHLQHLSQTHLRPGEHQRGACLGHVLQAAALCQPGSLQQALCIGCPERAEQCLCVAERACYTEWLHADCVLLCVHVSVNSTHLLQHHANISWVTGCAACWWLCVSCTRRTGVRRWPHHLPCRQRQADGEVAPHRHATCANRMSRVGFQDGMR